MAKQCAEVSKMQVPLYGLWRSALAVLLAAVAVNAAVAEKQTLAGMPLVKALRHGGYVLVMRHASSPRATPTAETAEPDNSRLERQLDAVGRSSARAMGEAIRTLRIPVGDVLSSPTYRALETVRLAALPSARSFDELGDGGTSMRAADMAQGAWLQRKVAERPRASANTIVVTHLPNISSAFGEQAAQLADGEMLVFRPDAKGGAELVGRIKIEEWPGLAARR
jgi:phosphohistidine phosphatase SixA